MGAHLRNGRDISAEQQQQDLELQSKYPISSSAAERLCRVREQLAASTSGQENILPSGAHRFQPGSVTEGRQSVRNFPSPSFKQVDTRTASRQEIPVGQTTNIDTSVDSNPRGNESTRAPEHGNNPFGQSTGEPSFVYGRGTLYPSLRHRHQHARPAMEPVPKGLASTEHPLNEDGFTTSHFHAGSSHESRGPQRDAQSQPTVDSARLDGPLGAISPEQHNTRYHDSSVDTGRANGHVNPTSPRSESNQLRSEPYRPKTGSPRDPSRTRPECTSSDPRDHLPGSLPTHDTRALDPPATAAESTVYYTPGVPEPNCCHQTGYGSTDPRKPTTSTPLRQSTTILPEPSSQHVVPTAPQVGEDQTQQ
ncbi:hypothetical protein PSHT_16362 [Puccinia striiformis]|uniref:Uncharacterized protein n=1 Tax=Puccinia striiformis TaxID=27350 RepID=A0A2S4UA85_9BASI|nr:hypothetical protein PSHT_16362 [Puccinia striiformis]